MPRLGLLIRGCWLSCANTIPVASSVRCQIWVRVDALTKTFHSLTAGARVLLLGCVVMSRQLARPLRMRERNSPKKCTINRTMRLRFAHLVWSMRVLGNKEDAIREGERAVELIAS